MTIRTRATLMLLLVAGTGSLGGCGIGFNRLLFVTKTTVGLEVDTKPPSAQLAIDRLEGYYGPQFEKGKTLPVMASFRFKSDRPLSAYVGSAFATGDAAVTLSALYADEDPDLGVWSNRWREVQKVDSSLVLDKKPVVSNALVKMCSETGSDGEMFQQDDVRPVFFGTDTSLGVKVAWSGLTASIPDTFRVGFSRKELAWAPVTTQKNDATGKYHVKTASLLATVDTGIDTPELAGSGPTLPVSYVQYFATGDAATLLATRKAVRLAMFSRLDPNQGLRAKVFAESVRGLTVTRQRLAITYVVTIYEELRRISGTDTEALRLKNDLDRITPTLLAGPFGTLSRRYSFTPAHPPTKAVIRNLGPASQAAVPFRDVGVQWKVWFDSVVALKKAAMVGSANLDYAAGAAGTASAPNTHQRAQMLQDLADYEKALPVHSAAIWDAKEVVAAVEYYRSLIPD